MKQETFLHWNAWLHLTFGRSIWIMLDRAIGRASSTLSPGHKHFPAQAVLEEIDRSMSFVIHGMASSSHYYVRRGRPPCCTCRHTGCRTVPDHMEHGGAGVALQEGTSASSPNDG